MRANLPAQGTPIGPYDLMIAATAIANNLTLVTADMRHFVHVVGLRFEDWKG